MNKVEYTYRGSLKSCNYTCYYCPFSKKKATSEEINRDRKELADFFINLDNSSKKNIFITPYGEALIHKYYREEIEKNILRDDIENIGIQTNLSLDVVSWLEGMKSTNLPLDKINLWITCHFEQTDYKKFLSKINHIYRDINISVGVVGIPEDYDKILKLRKDLPREVYLWINEYSKIMGEYSQDLIEKFQSIDPIFYRKNEIDFSKSCSCGGESFFVEGSGKVKLCNRNPRILGNFYKKSYFQRKGCTKKNCDCYLTFSKFDSDVFNFFGSKKFYRIPRKIKVENIFFDIDGTIIENGKVSEKVMETIKFLYEKGYKLYFITDLPIDIALRKCHKIKKYFSGGIFQCGAHISMENLDIYETIQANISPIKGVIKKIYSYNEAPYKILLESTGIDIPGTKLLKGVPNILVKEGVNKFTALKKVSGLLNYNIDEILVVGNDINDIVLFKNIRNSICVLGGNSKAKSESRYILDLEHIPYILE